MSVPHPVIPDLETLVGLFHGDVDALGAFDEVDIALLPPVFKKLLAHEHHMTVTVEAHHNSPVDVGVLQTHVTKDHYAREIVLTRQSDGAVVQYGIMRVNLSYLSDDVREEIESQATPLGRILIRHNVLRSIHLFSLWKVVPGGPLRRALELAEDVPAAPIYGRTALIYCNDEPAIELLEIVK